MLRGSTKTRLMQWNVFEDGLADTPGCISFDVELTASFEALLKVLSDSGGKGGPDFHAFLPTRDFTTLPDVAPITSIRGFFDVIDVVYTLVYHVLGGDTRLGKPASVDEPGFVPLRNSLRTLFLHSTLVRPADEPNADGTNQWSAPSFEREVQNATAPLSEPAAAAAADKIRAIRDGAFEMRDGTLSWDAGLARELWKKTTRADRKWMGLNNKDEQLTRGLRIFVKPPAPLGTAAAAALSTFCRVGPLSATPAALIELELDAAGALRTLRTPTLQSGVRWLLLRMCEHAKANPAAAAAVAAFAAANGESAPAAGAAADPAAWVRCIFPPLLRAMEAWSGAAALPQRHATLCRAVRGARPQLLTLVEHDAQWRQLPPPHAQLATLLGLGTASIMYDRRAFVELDASSTPRPSAWADEEEWPPGPTSLPREEAGGAKSSCVAVLRRKCDGVLFVVCAAHLESGKPSDSAKVRYRAKQMRTLLAAVGRLAAALRRSSLPAVVILGGDLNALREEFVLGNSSAFYEAPSVAAVTPRLKRPATDVPAAPPPEPPFACLGAAGELRLRCDGVDGGWLVEASFDAAGAAGAAVPCTRAGASMTIDFALVGGVGGAAVATAPHKLVSDAEAAKCAAADDGVRQAVMRWGSDHLPVACDIDARPDASRPAPRRAPLLAMAVLGVAVVIGLGCVRRA